MDITELLSIRKCRYEHVPHEPTYSAQRLAGQLHVPGRDVAKAVLLRVNGKGERRFVLAVLAADQVVDFQQVARLLGARNVELAAETEIADHYPDCDFGVLLPFGSHCGITTIVDAGLTEDDEIWFEGNTRTEAIRMKFADYVRIEKPVIASIQGRFRNDRRQRAWPIGDT